MARVMKRFGTSFQDVRWRTIARRLDRNIMAATSRDDAAFWWGERALNGLLAATFHRDGHWSVTEPLACGHQQGSRKRPDMWMGFGGVQDGWFTLEAKITWPHKENPGAVVAKLAHAEQQLCELGDGFRTGRPLAGCWVVPRSKREQMQRPEGNAFVKKHATALWKHLGETGEQDRAMIVAMAPEGPVHHNGIEYYPGVILCLWNRAGIWRRG